MHTAITPGVLIVFGVTAMKQQDTTTDLMRATVTAVICSICGGMLASFGNLISSSTFMVTATIVVAAILGAWLGRFRGAINGAILGGLATALGSVIGGSPIGVL